MIYERSLTKDSAKGQHFGRCVSKEEYDKVKQSNKLDNGNQYVPVFDCSRKVESNIRLKGYNGRRNLFRSIGVTDPYLIVLFKIEKTPYDPIGPIKQKNGLLEYRFPDGTEIEIYNILRL